MSAYMDSNQVMSLAAALLASVKSHVSDRDVLAAIANDFERLVNRPDP